MVRLGLAGPPAAQDLEDASETDGDEPDDRDPDVARGEQSEDRDQGTEKCQGDH